MFFLQQYYEIRGKFLSAKVNYKYIEALHKAVPYTTIIQTLLVFLQRIKHSLLLFLGLCLQAVSILSHKDAFSSPQYALLKTRLGLTYARL